MYERVAVCGNNDRLGEKNAYAVARLLLEKGGQNDQTI